MIEKDNDFSINLLKTFQEFSNSSHHAFIVESVNREEVFNFFQNKIKDKYNTNESIFLNLKVFDIKKAKEILKYKKNKFLNKHFILLSFYSINLEAQNALLKFIEEAENNIKIILIIHKGANILPTIYSRLYKLNVSEEKLENNKDENFLRESVNLFLKTKNINRMNLKEIKDLLSKKDEYALLNEDKERNDREVLEKFLIKLHDIVFEKYEEIISNNKERSKEYLEYLEDILDSIRYAKNNSSSGKVLLEYLSLKLPII